ncbi:MAG: hypothetical protein LQ338_001153 [Usnochroma carphineum]|nr:MAG: hypothetical protein LQ338_001153 [Usnochroma carphineum]
MSQALTKCSSDSALMPPPPPPKRIKRPAKVLDEDAYTDALSHIIARDFFPGLLETESQQEYLNALDSQNNEWIAAAGKRLSEVMTPGPDGRRLRGRRGTSMTPMTGLHGISSDTPQAWQGDTPVSTKSTKISTASNEQAAVATNMSLSAFQSKYTSEDNESFYKLLDKQNLKRSERYAWMWSGNKIPAARQIAHRKGEEQKLLASSERSSTAEINGQEVALIRPDDQDNRKAMPDSWRSGPDNNFMFTPSSIEDSVQTVAQKAGETSKAPPKAVVYDNTRLPTSSSTTDTPEGEIPPSPSLSAIQDAIVGRPRPTASEAAFGGTRAETPRVNGYAFVDSEESSPPSPPPASSHLFLGTGGQTPNPFKMQERSKREALHHRMVDHVAKGKRVKSQVESLKTPVPRFMSSPRVAKGGLTPAGQRLLGTMEKMGKDGLVGGTPGVGRTPGVWERGGRTGSRLKEGWTPRG